MTQKRFANIDVLRGFSVLVVLASHYGLTGNFPFSGTHAVAIFFMVSGYCMELTVSRRGGFVDFWKARFWRLYPTLLLCMLVTAGFEYFYSDIKPDRTQGYMDVIFNAVCIPTAHIACDGLAVYRGHPTNFLWVDGAYWSLLVEFRFYLLFSLLYFSKLKFVRDNLAYILSALCLMSLPAEGKLEGKADDFLAYLSFFAFGIGFYNIAKNKVQGMIQCVCAFVAFAIVGFVGVQHASITFNQSNVVSYLSCFVIFAAVMSLRSNHLSGHFVGRAVQALCYVGLISYPLYLLHQDIGLILIQIWRPVLGPWAVLATIAAAITAATLVYVIFEERFVAWFKRAW